MSGTNRSLISPDAARARIRTKLGDGKAAERFFFTYAQSGGIYVQADQVITDSGSPKRGARVEPATLARLAKLNGRDFWNLAAVTLHNPDVELAGIQVAEQDIDDALAQYAPPLPQPQGVAGRGGRTSEKHGWPIAKMTMRLLKEPPDQFARWTGEALEPELKKLYAAQGQGFPSTANLVNISRGVLRAVREARNS